MFRGMVESMKGELRSPRRTSGHSRNYRSCFRRAWIWKLGSGGMRNHSYPYRQQMRLLRPVRKPEGAGDEECAIFRSLVVSPRLQLRLGLRELQRKRPEPDSV